MVLAPGVPLVGIDPGLHPIAERVGPFPWPGFLQAWWEELEPPGELLAARHRDSAMWLFLCGTRLELAGDSDLTDYHSPLGRDVFALSRALAEQLPPGTQLSLDSLPAEASKPIEEGLIAAGLAPRISEHEVAMVLDLPDNRELFYELVGRKERHELARKRRRYESEIGGVELSTERGEGRGLEEFIRLHRLSEGRKGAFMTPPRERFFRRLASQPGWRVDLLTKGEQATACLFAWSDEDTYYLYNSSYDPELAHASPGIVALAAIIERVMEEGIRHLDFLKGAEAYKSRLGAHPRPLFLLEAAIPGRAR